MTTQKMRLLKVYHEAKNPEIIFQNDEELKFDKIIAENCLRVSIYRHAGSIRKGYLNGH